MKRFVKCLAVLMVLSSLLVSCNKNKSAWLTDYTTAQEQAQKTKKNMLLLFSGDDWDGTSQTLKETVLNQKAFYGPASKKYVLVNIDFSQEEYAKVNIADDATEEEIAEAQRIEQLYVEREDLAERFNLSAYPSLYVISPEGLALSQIFLEPLSSVELGEEEQEDKKETPASLLEKIEATEEEQQILSELIAKIDAAEGLDRVRAIDALYQATDPELRNPLSTFAQEVVSLDPQNQTGLVGKYEYELANERAMQYAMYTGDVVSASKEFELVCETGHLSELEKQNAYYMAAYILAMSSEPDFDKMLELLDRSYQQDTNSDLAAQILGVIENIRQVKEEYSQQ